VWRNGRRDRLKICFTQVSGGSSPSTGTLFLPLILVIHRVDLRTNQTNSCFLEPGFEAFGDHLAAMRLRFVKAPPYFDVC
jgi:hypothetical protein